MRTAGNQRCSNEPLPPELVPRTLTDPVRWVGAVALPLAGPYRPLAHLYAGPDGTLWWTVRLWDVDRARLSIVPTETLTAYARANGLTALAAEIDRQVARARRRGR